MKLVKRMRLFGGFILLLGIRVYADPPMGFIGNIDISKHTVTAAEPTLLTVMSSWPELPSGGKMVVVRVDENGRVLSELAAMVDDGTHGDQYAGDKIFAGQLTLQESSPGAVHLEVIAKNESGFPLAKSMVDTVFVEEPGAADRALVKLSDEIAAGRMDEVLKYFDLTDQVKTQDLLRNLDSTKRAQVAQFFRNAKLREERNDTRIYDAPLQNPDGQTSQEEILVQPDGHGHWIVTGW